MHFIQLALWSCNQIQQRVNSLVICHFPCFVICQLHNFLVPMTLGKVSLCHNFPLCKMKINNITYSVGLWEFDVKLWKIPCRKVSCRQMWTMINASDAVFRWSFSFKQVTLSFSFSKFPFVILNLVLTRRNAWTSLGQSWTVGLRPVLWTALNASLIQANSSWIDWNRPRNPSQCSQKAFLTDFSLTFLEKEGSWRMVEEKAMGALAPTFDTLGAFGHQRMNKDQFFVCFRFKGHMCVWCFF